MRIFDKTLAYWWERRGGLILGLLIIIPILSINPQLSNWIPFIKEIPVIAIFAFGFLLTLLSIILQGNSEYIQWIKSRKILFQRFVNYNKRIVIISLILIIYSYFLIFFDFTWFKELFNLSSSLLYYFQTVLLSGFIILITWFLFDIIRFIRLFYILIKNNN